MTQIKVGDTVTVSHYSAKGYCTVVQIETFKMQKLYWVENSQGEILGPYSEEFLDLIPTEIIDLKS